MALSPQEQLVKRVQAHLVIGDAPSACEEAYAGLQAYPDSKLLWQAYIRTLAKVGDEKGMMRAWHEYVARFPEEAENREILECLAWAVIEKGTVSSSPIIRVTGMLGAFFSQDAKGVVLLQKGLHDDNSFLRGAAVKLSSHLLDDSLQDEILRMLKSEPIWSVRLEIIKAIGAMRILEARKDLEAILANESSHIQEKVAAIEALVMMLDGVEKEKITALVESDRAGLRLLACELVAYFDQTGDVDLLFPLITDYHPDVRAKVYEVLGRMRVPSMQGQTTIDIAAKGVLDPDPLVAATAAWLLTINDQQKGLTVFDDLIKNRSRDGQHLAAGALASTGKYGVPLMLKIFKTHQDPYVQMNLALGLIGQRAEISSACDCLYKGLLQRKERWAWREEGNFKILAPSKVKHDEAIPNYPEAMNQLTRLEVLEVLAIVQYPHAQQAIKKFLQESQWGISGLASALLLTEGDESAVDLVKELLTDSDQKVRMQAAIILALWGKGDDAVRFLQEAYPEADRDLKGQILEGIGRVGSSASLSFLAERLQEPYPTTRIIAAAALLECLYH